MNQRHHLPPRTRVSVSQGLGLALALGFGLVGAAVLGARDAAADGGLTMQAQMKTQVAPALAAADGAALAAALDKVAANAPDGDAFKDWKSFAQKGAAAARAGKIEEAKATCKGCHDPYKKAYKENPALHTKALK